MSIKKIDGYDIYLTKILGKGSFGSVYLGKQLTTGDQVAVKVLSKDSSNNKIILVDKD
jgi:serine/threonine protein kinase